MAKVYRTVGSLAEVLYELESNKVTDIQSLDDILTFRDKPDDIKLKYKEVAKKKVASKIKSLEKKFSELSRQYDQISTEVQQIPSEKTHNPFKKLSRSLKRNQLETDLKQLEDSITDVRKELTYLKENSHQVTEETFSSLAKNILKAKSVIEDNSHKIFGAIGEEKAVSELKKLPNSYHIINDFNYEFPKAIHRKKEDDWIKSIQADHIVIGPSGVFVVETKNWSNKSIQSLDLFSPVEQVRRHSYALFMLLNNAISPSSSFKFLKASLKHHWGTQQIAVHSIILMVNAKPNQKFQHVKICSLADLQSHIIYFSSTLSKEQTQALADFLLDICEDS